MTDPYARYSWPRTAHRLVGLFEIPDVAIREIEFDRLDRILQMLDARRAVDGRGHAILVEQPREADLAHAGVVLVGESPDALVDRLALRGVVSVRSHLAHCVAFLVGTSEIAARERRPRDHADVLLWVSGNISRSSSR